MKIAHRQARVEFRVLRSDARVAEGGALLRRYTGLNRYREFESLSLRQISSFAVHLNPLWAVNGLEHSALSNEIRILGARHHSSRFRLGADGRIGRSYL